MNPKSRTDDAMGLPSKDQYCGDPTYVRAAHPDRITTYPPGAQVLVQWTEPVNHTSYYRVAFQPSGETFANPLSFQENKTGMVDAAGAMIIADQIPDATHELMITLPNEPCTTCTIQLIQMMMDDPQYDPVADIYYNCADITIEAGAPMPPDPMNMDDAGPGAGGDAGTGAVGGPNEVTGGCSTSGSSTTALFGLALIAGLRRRRR